MVNFANLFKIWSWALESDPYGRKQRLRNAEGVGISDTQSIPNLRGDGDYFGGSRTTLSLHGGRDLIDLSSVSNRISRYKEYERLQSVPEIGTALTVFADESCVAGNTKIATPFGYFTIEDLANTKREDEEFLVYCYDFSKNDYTLGWAYHPRIVKRAKTIKFILDNGTTFSCTDDHRVLLRSGEWIQAGNIKEGFELMPFYRLKGVGSKTEQFARIYTQKDGWKTERAFIDSWRRGEQPNEKLSQFHRLIKENLTIKQISSIMKIDPHNLKYMVSKDCKYSEIKTLYERYPDKRRVLHICDDKEQDVYDLSVKNHENFATDTTIFHNCQLGSNGHVFTIDVKNKDISKELNELFFRRLKMDRNLWNIARTLYLKGDHFMELVIDPEDPKLGIIKFQNLPADSMYRIETIKTKLVEFQQSKEGPDYQSLMKYDVSTATEQELSQSTAIRFSPSQIIHLRVGEERTTFYPYGISLVEAARGPAHNLKLMEDAMLVNRLSRAPERRVYYIDVGGLPPFRQEQLMQKMQDMLRKKKVYNARGGSGGSAVEERFNTASFDDDIWVPTKANSNTRIETLPGASNLGEIDDALYFRNKLFIALNFPKSYMAQEDVSLTKMSLSSVDFKFSRLVQRLQASIADGLMEIAVRHLELVGYPPELYEDLQIVLTPPSHGKEISDNEVMQIRYDRALALKGSGIFSDYDILVKILQVPADEAKELVARAMIQKVQDLKLQVMASNPVSMGLVTPGPQGNEMGTTQGGPNPELTGEEQPPQEGEIPGTLEAPEKGEEDIKDSYGSPEQPQGKSLPDPEEKDIKRYDLEIMSLGEDIDEEELEGFE